MAMQEEVHSSDVQSAPIFRRISSRAMSFFQGRHKERPSSNHDSGNTPDELSKRGSYWRGPEEETHEVSSDNFEAKEKKAPPSDEEGREVIERENAGRRLLGRQSRRTTDDTANPVSPKVELDREYTQQFEGLEQIKDAQCAAEKQAADQAADEKAKAEALVELENLKADALEEQEKIKKDAARAAEKQKEEAEKGSAEATRPSRPPPLDPVRFKDAVGRKFNFPFELCRTWAVSTAYSWARSQWY